MMLISTHWEKVIIICMTRSKSSIDSRLFHCKSNKNINFIFHDLSSSLVVDIPKVNKKAVAHKININKNKLVCLFVSKLETYKGCLIFVEAMIKAMQQGIELHSIIIGEGSQKKNIETLIQKEDMSNNFSILGNIPHNDIFYYHSISNIYISLNQLGNMSNTNLEAIKFGQVVIFPRSLDNETDNEDIKLFGEKKILWIKNP